MIGQHNLIKKINVMLASGFPRFTIISGGVKSGKKLLATYIASKLQAHLITSEIKVDDIREIINLAYKQSEPIVYLIPDADKMSTSAKNALLKITEEPPRQAYFIMTLTDLNNTLATLRSRGNILQIEPYLPEQLHEYAKQQGYHDTHSLDELEIMQQVCTTPGEVDILFAQGDVFEFYKYAETVVDNIGVVNGANAFKIALKLDLKDTGELGYNVTMFLRTIIHLFLKKMHESPTKQHAQAIKVTCKYLSQLGIKGVDKSTTIDMWILEVRGVLNAD